MPLKQLIHHLGYTMPLEFLAWNSIPLNFSRIGVKVILINITKILIIINNNESSSNSILGLNEYKMKDKIKEKKIARLK